MCLLKKGITTDDEGIFKKIKQTGTNYYTYYAITQNGENKLYVSNFNEAQKIIDELKNKNSANKDEIKLEEKYSTNLEEFAKVEDAIAKLYQEPKINNTKLKVASISTARTSNYRTTTSTPETKMSLGITLSNPTTGIITSKYGYRTVNGVRGFHTGLDIASSSGTPIKAAAAGVVKFAGYNGNYGNLVIISHGNGIETYYAHASSLVAKTGDKVSQGQLISKMGRTGRATGVHLHFEVRKDGQTLNPIYYVNY